METWAALLQLEIAGPLLLFAITLGLFVGLAQWLDGHLNTVPFCHVLFRWVGQPLFRVIPLLLFLSLSANAFLGWNTPVSPDTVNGLVTERLSSLINALFIASLLLPQLPVLTRFHAPLLLLQLILAFCLLFRWQMQILGIETYHLLPGLSEGFIIIALSLAMHSIGSSWARAIGRWVEHRYHRKQGDLLADEMLAVLLQSPALILYTRHLGQQAEWFSG